MSGTTVITAPISAALIQQGDELIVLDAGADVGGRLTHALTGDLLHLPVSALTQTELIDTVVASIRARCPRRVVGIGGGRLHDAVALARIGAVWTPELERIRARTMRTGPIATAVDPASLPGLTLVPTTIGPGSETSAVACSEVRGLRSIVVGPALRADRAIIDAGLTDTLSDRSLLEGAAEAALRVLGSRAGAPPDAAADSSARRLLVALLNDGGAVARGDRTTHRRLRLSRCSAATHTSAPPASPRPFAATHWYLANELSSVLGSRKVPVSMPILGALWRAASMERLPWLDGARVHEVWGWAAEVLGTSEDVAGGVAQWRDRWKLASAHPRPEQLHTAAVRISERWGGTGPALPGAGPEHILPVLLAAFPSAMDEAPGATRAGSEKREGGE